MKRSKEPYVFAGRMHDLRGPFGAILSVSCEGPGCEYCHRDKGREAAKGAPVVRLLFVSERPMTDIEKAARAPSEAAMNFICNVRGAARLIGVTATGETVAAFAYSDEYAARQLDDLIAQRLSAVLLEPSEEVVRSVNDALDNFVPLSVRRNKSREGDQWEVVQGPPEDEAISDDNTIVVNVYATSIEAHAVAEKRNGCNSARAALRAAALSILGRDAPQSQTNPLTTHRAIPHNEP